MRARQHAGAHPSRAPAGVQGSQRGEPRRGRTGVVRVRAGGGAAAGGAGETERWWLCGGPGVQSAALPRVTEHERCSKEAQLQMLTTEEEERCASTHLLATHWHWHASKAADWTLALVCAEDLRTMQEE